jgi:serine/threonine protein phosphatase PrpC/cell division protein FtsL
MAKFDADKWSVGARSETGYVRDENQDRMSWIRAPFGDVYIVSDGMGGVGDGALAAELTVQTLQQHLGKVRHWLRGAVRHALEAANEAVYTCAHTAGAGTPGMGATAVVVLARASSIMVAHAGDSRAYLFNDAGHCQRLTKDHSRVQRMVDSGMLSAAQALTHPDANVIERAVGHAQRLEVEVSAWLPLRNGDRIMLCSDGLCGYADDVEIASVLRDHSNPQEAADKLVELALAKGGEDNITVQVIRYHGGAANEHGMRPAGYLAVVLTTAAAAMAAVLIGQRLPPVALEAQNLALQRQVAELRERVREHEKKSDELQERLVSGIRTLQSRLDTIAQELGRRGEVTDAAKAARQGRLRPPGKQAKTNGNAGASNATRRPGAAGGVSGKQSSVAGHAD